MAEMINNKIPPFPKAATVSELKEYYAWHEREGRGDCIGMARMMCYSIPPLGSDTFDAKRRQVYTNLIPE